MKSHPLQQRALPDMERGRGVYYTAWDYRKDSERILAAGTAGIHRTDLSEDHE